MKEQCCVYVREEMEEKNQGRQKVIYSSRQTKATCFKCRLRCESLRTAVYLSVTVLVLSLTKCTKSKVLTSCLPPSDICKFALRVKVWFPPDVLSVCSGKLDTDMLKPHRQRALSVVSRYEWLFLLLGVRIHTNHTHHCTRVRVGMSVCTVDCCWGSDSTGQWPSLFLRA